MSETEKPLHVQVAEALGWTWRLSPTGGCAFLAAPTVEMAEEFGAYNAAAWTPAPVGARPCDDAYRYVPRYDTDWSATGPLIERLNIHVRRGDVEKWWLAAVGRCVSPQVLNPGVIVGGGRTYLGAVCNLILALKAADKLRALTESTHKA